MCKNNYTGRNNRKKLQGGTAPSGHRGRSDLGEGGARGLNQSRFVTAVQQSPYPRADGEAPRVWGRLPGRAEEPGRSRQLLLVVYLTAPDVWRVALLLQQ